MEVDRIPSQNDIEILCVIDDANGHYMVVEVGWQAPRRVHRVACHIRLKDDKVWVEYDRTPHGITHDLLKVGIPSTDIELGFQPPERRPYVAWPERGYGKLIPA